MFEAVPLWVWSILGSGLMVFLLVQGVRLTTKKGDKKDSSSKDTKEK